MNLIILGKGNIKEDIRYNTAVTKVWTVGTSEYPDADLYFEFHDIPVNHPQGKVITQVPEMLSQSDLPLNNSICIMLAMAVCFGEFDTIRIAGCPMNTKEEYIEQRTALAYMVGYYRGKGYKIIWDDLPENTHYGLRGGQAL